MSKLIECPMCKRMISPNALSCPHCGEPIKSMEEVTSKENNSTLKNEEANENTCSIVKIIGYKEKHSSNPSVSIYFNDRLIGKIPRNEEFLFETKNKGIIKFICGFAQTSVDFDSQKSIVIQLSGNFTAGELIATILDADKYLANNLQTIEIKNIDEGDNLELPKVGNDKIYCSACGTELYEGQEFCPYCGKKSLLIKSGNSAIYSTTKTSYNTIDDSGGVLWSLIGFLFPIIGLIMYISLSDTKPQRAKDAGIGALIGIMLGGLYIIV